MKRYAVHYPVFAQDLIDEIREQFYKKLHFVPTYSQIMEAAIHLSETSKPKKSMSLSMRSFQDEPYRTIRVSEEIHNKVKKFSKECSVPMGWMCFVMILTYFYFLSNGTHPRIFTSK